MILLKEISAGGKRLEEVVGAPLIMIGGILASRQ